MTAAWPPVPRSLQGLRDDQSDRAAPAQESAAADAASDVAAEATQQEIARIYARSPRGTLHAATLRSLRHLLLSGAGGVPLLPVDQPCIRGRAAARHPSRRNDGTRAE